MTEKPYAGYPKHRVIWKVLQSVGIRYSHGEYESDVKGRWCVARNLIAVIAEPKTANVIESLHIAGHARI